MVKLGKKFKGFDIERDITEKENKKKIEKKEDRENDNIIETDVKEPLTLPNYLLKFTGEKTTEETNIDELDSYLTKNDIHKLSALLLYKILMEKPENVCEFILNELKQILIERGHVLPENEKQKEKENKNEEENENENKEKKEQENERQKNEQLKMEAIKNETTKNETTKIAVNIRNTDIFVNPNNYEQFLGSNHLTLEDLMNVLSLLKIENEDKIYFNNLKKIIEIVDSSGSSKNENNFLIETANQTENIPMDTAEELVTTFYKNYFYNQKSII